MRDIAAEAQYTVQVREPGKQPKIKKCSGQSKDFPTGGARAMVQSLVLLQKQYWRIPLPMAL